MSQAVDEIKIGGIGASRKRVEDDRFIRGKGNYTDDIVLPGMLHMEILRSPLPHARIRSIDTSKAWQIPGVHLVLTGEMMASRNLAWMPTLSYDTQAVLATDKVRFQGQEVACVIADDPYIAKDACEAIDVDYEPLPPIVNPVQALADGAPLIRDDKENQPDNVIYNWEVGDGAGTDRAFAQADLVSKLELHYPRSHPSPIECCGSIADFNRATSKLTVYMTTQAPHIIRAAVAMVAELPEHMIRIISPDIGGGFGNKVPVYPGYVCSILASILLERPVKWIEDKSGNLISTGFARDVYLKGEMALRKDGKILAVRMHTDADHGAFFSDAQPSKFKIGLMHSAFAAYDIPVAHLTARGVYTNKAPGGVAYRCSFRVTEAMFFQERMMQAAATDLGIDQAAFRRMNFVADDDFPHRTPFGFLTDSGQYAKCLDVGLRAVGYEDFRKRQEEARARGRLLGLGISTMTEPLGAGNSREYDILGIKMFDSAELKVHMTGKAIVRTGATRRRARDTRRRGRRSWPMSSASRRKTWWSRKGTRTPLRSAWAPTRPAARRWRARRWRWCAARSAPRPASWPRTCWRSRRRTSTGSSAGSTCAAPRTAGSPSRNARWPRTATCPTAWSRAWRTPPTTTRRTSPGRSPSTSSRSR